MTRGYRKKKTRFRRFCKECEGVFETNAKNSKVCLGCDGNNNSLNANVVFGKTECRPEWG